jgi:molybdopterin/thiamine biosynthesis adenylyltransferase
MFEVPYNFPSVVYYVAEGGKYMGHKINVIDSIEYSYCSFGPSKDNFAKVMNVSYYKYATNWIFRIGKNSPYNPLYNLIGESPVDRRDLSLFESKVASAQDSLARLNPEVTIQTLAVRAEGELLHRLVAQADVVLDCSDNFATRHAVNRACVALKKPLVSGAGIRFDGQVAVFDARIADSPCYECLFPEQAEPEEVRCAVMGVFAPLTGIIGCMQAAEAIKCLTGIGLSLAGRLLLFDALRTEWRSIRVPRDPQCSVCAAAA